MTAALLDGNLVSSQLKQKIKSQVEIIKNNGKRSPGLAVILVGEDPASKVYVNNKRKACAEVEFNSYAHYLPITTTEKQLLELITYLNHANEVDGILVQLPLPDTMDTNKILECINPHKDVDGFHPYNMGRLAQRNPLLRPCTPYGIIKLLEFYQIPIKSKHTVVIGASNIVGRPMALEFLLAGATVTICHQLTKNLKKYIEIADILVVAAGVQGVIDIDWLKNNQSLVDVGIHRLENGKLQGDVDFNQASHKVAWITPVPGGVGPMTIATLLSNTLTASQLSIGDLVI